MTRCACGCGEEVTPGKTWRHGHYARVRNPRVGRHWSEYPTERTATGCVRWLGPKESHGRYGSWRGRAIHRVVWEETHGPIPAGLLLDHVHDRGCRHTDCINLEHLELITRRANGQRAPHIRAQAAQTECVHGHALSGDNLAISPTGKRRCRACARKIAARSAARSRAKKREEKGALLGG